MLLACSQETVSLKVQKLAECFVLRKVSIKSVLVRKQLRLSYLFFYGFIAFHLSRNRAEQQQQQQQQAPPCQNQQELSMRFSITPSSFILV